MKTVPLYLIAGMLAVTATASLGADTVPPPPSPNSLQQIGANLADAQTTRDVQVMLSRVVNDGLTEARFDNLVADLARPDRERMSNFKNHKLDDLNRVITQFRADFKAKYNQDFDLRPEHLKDAMVYAGKDKNSATVAVSDATFMGKPKTAPGPAPVSIAPAKPIANSVTLNMINEGSFVANWRVDVPNEITAAQLKANLIKHIQMLDDLKSTWPADPATAYHAAAYHILQSLTESSIATER